MLDFGIANFLDRISYKNPKSSDKISKFKKRMAVTAKPINQYDIFNGEMPEDQREEEKFIYTYLQNKGPKKEKKK